MYRGLLSAHASVLPVASDAALRVICLPIYPDLHDSEIDLIIRQLACPL